MEPANQSMPITIDSLTPSYFTYEQQALGMSTVDQYIYVFFGNKIRVYEKFINSITPELIEQIYVPTKAIKLFSINKEYIAVLFQDHTLDVRLRQHWEVVQYSTNLQKEIEISEIAISQNKVIFSYKKQTQILCYGFIDIDNKEQVKIWQHNACINKLIHRNKLNEITNLYITLQKQNTIKYGLLYVDQYRLKPYQIWESSQSSNKVYDIDILQNTSQVYMNDNQQNPMRSIYLFKLIQNKDKQQSTKQTKQIKLVCCQFHQYREGTPPSTDETQKIYKQYESILNSLEQFDDSNKKQIQICLVLPKDADFQQMKIIANKKLIYIGFTDQIFQISFSQIKGLTLNNIYSKSKNDKLVSLSQDFIIMGSQAWTVASLNINHKNISMSSPKKSINKIKVSDKELQTDTLDQFDQKYMNQIIDKLFQRKKVIDIGTQTIFEECQPQPNKQYSDVQTITQNEDAIQQKQTIHHHTQIIKYFPNKQHNTEISKLHKNIKELESNLEYRFSAKIQDTLKNQHQKLKQNCIKALKKICQQEVVNNIVPIIQQKLTITFQHKLNQINQYIYSLCIQNLYHLRDQYEKDHANQQTLKNNLMKKQIFEIEQCKKAVAKILQISKVREIQKLVFFEQVKKKITEVDNRITNLNTKVQQIISQEGNNQNHISQQIQAIKDMLKFRNEKKIDPPSSQVNSQRESQQTDKEIVEEDESQEESYQSQKQEEQDLLPLRSYPPQIPPRTYIPQPPPFYHHPPPISNHYPGMHPPDYGYKHHQGGYQAYNPYQIPYQFSTPSYPATQGPYSFYAPQYEAYPPMQPGERKNIKKKKHRNK